MRGGLSYLSRAIAAALGHEQRGVVEVYVAHDQDCPRLIGGECACVPDITAVRTDGARMDIGQHGEVSEGRQLT